MARLEIEVIYAGCIAQEIVTVELEEGATALDALLASGLAARHKDIDKHDPLIGIFGRRVPPGTPLRGGDRVEIYRPLVADPREARRAKAAAKKRLRR